MNNKNLKILFFKNDKNDKKDINEIVAPKKNETIVTNLLKDILINNNTKTNIDTIDEHLNNTILISSLVKTSKNNLENAVNTVEKKSESNVNNVENKSESTGDNVENKSESTGDIKPESTGDIKPESTEDIKPESTEDIKPESTGDIKPESTGDNKPENIKINKNQQLINSLLIKIDEKFESEKNKKIEELDKIKNEFIINSDAERYLLKSYIKSKLENSKIPLIIYQTWMTKILPEKMAKSIEKIKIANPEFEHKLFDDTDCRNFIIDNFNDNVLYAYDNLIPGAFKADLWRYCILYIHGGIYLDIKYEPVNNFKFMELIDKDYFVLDRASYFKGTIGIYNAFIISQPNNTIFLKLIKGIVDNVKSKYYGINALSVTGPSLVGKILYPNTNKYTPSLEKEFDLKYANDGLGIEYKGKKILLQYPEYRRDQTKYTKTSYQNLWDKKKIYKN
jgi:hypothetical protein